MFLKEQTIKYYQNTSLNTLVYSNETGAPKIL